MRTTATLSTGIAIGLVVAAHVAQPLSTTLYGQDAGTPGAYLGDLTWPEAELRMREAPLVILPFGAGAKEHGPHLPMNADAVVMEYLCRQAVDSLPVLVAPPILHGWVPTFRDYPGTEVADPDVFQTYVREIALSLVRHGVRRIVFLNTGVTRATGPVLPRSRRPGLFQDGTLRRSDVGRNGRRQAGSAPDDA